MDFWAKFEPYEMNTLLVSPDVMVKLLKLPEFQNPLTGLNFQGTGKLSTPDVYKRQGWRPDSGRCSWPDGTCCAGCRCV